METAGNRLNLVILDACRNNPFRGRMRSATRGLARIQAASGSLVAFAAAPGQVAADGTGKHSPYTKALVEAMHVPGLAVEQVFKRVRIAVEKETGRRQTPWEESSLRGDFYFVPRKTDVTQTTGPVLSPAGQEWTAIQNTTSQAVLEAFIRRHPDSAYAEYARARLSETTVSNSGPNAEATPAPAEPKPDERVAALSEDSPGETGPDETPDLRELSLALQRELKRVGCDPGAIDGDWGPRSRRALKTFAEHGNKQLASLDPSADVLDAVKAMRSRVCPLECGPGKKLEGDRCIADPETTTPAPTSLDGVWIMTTRNNAHCTRRNIPAATVTVSGSRLSWTNSMGAYRVATLSGSGLYKGRAKSSLGGMLRYSIRLSGRSGSGSWHIVDGKCAGSLTLRKR